MHIEIKTYRNSQIKFKIFFCDHKIRENFFKKKIYKIKKIYIISKIGSVQKLISEKNSLDKTIFNIFIDIFLIIISSTSSKELNLQVTN